jgi:hypothetical protein
VTANENAFEDGTAAMADGKRASGLEKLQLPNIAKRILKISRRKKKHL